MLFFILQAVLLEISTALSILSKGEVVSSFECSLTIEVCWLMAFMFMCS